MIHLQHTAGNAAVTRMLQRQPAATAETRPGSAVNPENLEQMRLDVDFITAKLKQQVLDSGEEQELLDRVKAWAGWDESWAATGGAGTPFLDKFLVLLKTRTFPRATARMLFGLAGEEWINAYDGLFYELEGARKDALQAIVSKSQKQGTAGPETQQMESVYGFVGKRVGLGSWGILKQMGLAVMSIADALIWLEWRREGRPGDPPQLSPSVAKSFDDSAAILADIAKEGATAEEMERDKQAMMEEYGFGDRWGKIVGILMSAGMGSAGQTVKAISSAAQIAQGAQGVESAAKKIQLRIAAMRKANPKATWEDFIADDEVRLEIGNGLAALIGLIGSLAGDEGVVAEFLKRNHLLVSATVLTPMLKKAWMDYNDPDLAADPKKRQHVLEEDVATIVGTVASMIGSAYDAKRAQEKAAAEAKAKAEAQGTPPIEETGSAARVEQNSEFPPEMVPLPGVGASDDLFGPRDSWIGSDDVVMPHLGAEPPVESPFGSRDSWIGEADGPVPAGEPAPVPWEQLTAGVDQPTPRQSTGGFRSERARAGNREVITIEGVVGEQISQSESLADYTPTVPPEHATHAVGMQLGENLPEGIVSGPGADLNLSALKRVENATRDVMARAQEQGATAETKTTLMVEHRTVGGEDVPLLVGVTREAWVRIPGSDESFRFVDFEARVDPITRQVTIVRNDVIRPSR